jgi:hypothetical protein
MSKPTQNEDEFIAREQAVQLHKLAHEKAKSLTATERDERRRLHHMKCPKCGMDLHSLVYRGVTIDRCGSCHGTWLDAGELEQLAGHGGDVLQRIIGLFRSGPGPIGPEAG